MACEKLPSFEEQTENDSAPIDSSEFNLTIESNEQKRENSVGYEEYEIEDTLHDKKEKVMVEEKCSLEEFEPDRCDKKIDRQACISFADKETFAHHFIETTLRKMLKTAYLMDLCYESPIPDRSVRSSMFDLKLTKNFSCKEKASGIEEVIYYFRWPTVVEFSCQLIEKKIEEYIKTWYLTEDWRHCMKLVGQDFVDKMSRFHYAVIWSLPNSCYPVPQVEAKVLFTVTLRNDVPPCCPVEVSYCFEGNSHKHVPGRIQFKEQWLLDILYAKLKIYSSIKF